ncbi:hypothetical protein ACVWXN_006676 [Bradyrhizobium sp. i1.4.4]
MSPAGWSCRIVGDSRRPNSQNKSQNRGICNREHIPRFCELYRARGGGPPSVTMRQSHAAGGKLFVDYAADGAPVVVGRLTDEHVWTPNK